MDGWKSGLTLDLGGAALGLHASLTVFSKLVIGSVQVKQSNGGDGLHNDEHTELDEQHDGES